MMALLRSCIAGTHSVAPTLCLTEVGLLGVATTPCRFTHWLVLRCRQVYDVRHMSLCLLYASDGRTLSLEGCKCRHNTTA